VTGIPDGLVTALADRYRIERELGTGGMATVYLAADLRHERQVAIKVLRPELAAVLGAQRFVQEIKTTAQLSHPHILPLFDSGEAGGFLYYVMPFVQGETIRERLARETQLGIEEAIRIASEVADALDYAHRHGVIHRDIKPENVLLHEGGALVADFGIALAVAVTGEDRLTETGFAVGTPQYMSPEQVFGEPRLDARTDVYSLACVLFEMLAGQPPFTGATRQAVLARHATDPPPPIRTVRAGVPVSVATAIAKALGKAPADRYATATAFAEALAAREVEDGDRSIVVLPFENLSSDPAQEYFSDGLTEELIADLSGIRTLRVVSRSSAMTLKGVSKRAPVIAQDLGVRYVLEGSVRKAGNNLRITAQLVDATSDAHLWAGKYTGTLDDVFDLQATISQAIVTALRVELEPAHKHSATTGIKDANAYDCFLRARHEIWRGDKEALDRAVLLLRNGLRIVGENSLLYATLGHAHWSYVNMAIDPDPTHLEKADEYKAKALELDPESPMAHLLAGEIHWKHGRMKNCVRHLRKALELDPQNADILLVLSYVYAFVGRSAAARPLLRRLLRIDPLTPINHGVEGFVELFDGNFVGALEPGRRMFDMDPASDVTLWVYSLLLAWNGRIQDSPWNGTWADTATPQSTVAGIIKFLNHAFRGQTEAALATLSPDNIRAVRWDEQMSWELAVGYAALGLPNEALDWLENSVTRGFVNYPFLSAQDPFLEPLRAERRFEELMQRVKREWEAIEA